MCQFLLNVVASKFNFFFEFGNLLGEILKFLKFVKFLKKKILNLLIF